MKTTITLARALIPHSKGKVKVLTQVSGNLQCVFSGDKFSNLRAECFHERVSSSLVIA